MDIFSHDKSSDICESLIQDMGTGSSLESVATFASNNNAPSRRPSSNMADDDDVGTAASGGGEATGR